MRRAALRFSVLGTILLLGGCAQTAPTPVSMGALTPRPNSERGVQTLGAGDALGVAIHTSDVILAAAQERGTGTAVTQVQGLDDASLIAD